MTNNEEFEKILENIDENGPEPQEEPQRQYYFMKKQKLMYSANPKNWDVR